MSDSTPATAALPVCSRCQRKIITFDGSRPTICGNCQPDPPEPDLTMGLKIMLSVLVAAVVCMVILAVLNGG